jgi:hypothetical protein
MSFDWGVFYTQLTTSGITSCFTVISGVLVFVVGQWVIKFFIEPIHAQSKLLGEIAYSLTFYANIFGNADLHDKNMLIEVKTTLRTQASNLRASAWTIRGYWFWQLLRVVPQKRDVIRASENLIGLSNSVFDKEYRNSIDDRQGEIKKLLGFR